jgi:hypothetical protein
MTQSPQFHLSEEALQDVLIGLSSPESDEHLVGCAECKSQVEEFRSTMQLFNQASLRWSEARAAATIVTPVQARPWRPRLTPAVWALATAALLLVIEVPLWHQNRHSQQTAQAPAAPPTLEASATRADSEAQIAEDNDLLRSVNAVLDPTEVSPVSEYHLLDRPHGHRKGRPKVLNP